jgi:hypothetical protein
MENFNKKPNEGTLDLRPEGHEAAAQAAAAQKKAMLDKQAAISGSQNKGMDIKPKGFSEVPGISGQPDGDEGVFKIPNHELESPPVQATDSVQAQPSDTSNQASDLIQNPVQPSQEQTLATQQADGKANKQGFWSKLFGKR